MTLWLAYPSTAEPGHGASAADWLWFGVAITAGLLLVMLVIRLCIPERW